MFNFVNSKTENDLKLFNTSAVLALKTEEKQSPKLVLNCHWWAKFVFVIFCILLRCKGDNTWGADNKNFLHSHASNIFCE